VGRKRTGDGDQSFRDAPLWLEGCCRGGASRVTSRSSNEADGPVPSSRAACLLTDSARTAARPPSEAQAKPEGHVRGRTPPLQHPSRPRAGPFPLRDRALGKYPLGWLKNRILLPTGLPNHRTTSRLTAPWKDTVLLWRSCWTRWEPRPSRHPPGSWVA